VVKAAIDQKSEGRETMMVGLARSSETGIRIVFLSRRAVANEAPARASRRFDFTVMFAVMVSSQRRRSIQIMLEIPEGDEKDVPRLRRGFKAIRDVRDSFIAFGSISAGAFESNSMRRARRIPRLAAGGLSGQSQVTTFARPGADQDQFW
jgi:hypothetical protein